MRTEEDFLKPTVLVTFIKSGQGHIMSGQSIYDRMVEKYGEKYDVVKSYIMSEDGNERLIKVEDFLNSNVLNTNKCEFFGKFIFPFISLFGRQSLMRWVHVYLCKKSFAAMMEALKKRKPDVIVSTHYYISLCAVEYKRRYAPDCQVVTYVPDNIFPSFWETRDGYFVVMSELAERLALKRGFKREQVIRIPPSVRSEVADCPLTKEECREKYGLPADTFTVALADGAYMMGKAKKYVKKLMKSKERLTLLLLAGYNTEQYEKFKKLETRTKPNITLKVYGYLDTAYELYRAADVFITKGGANGLLDSIYMRTPLMVNYCPHIIEEANYKLFVKHLHCGVGAFRAGKAKKLVESYARDPSLLDEYRKNIDTLLSEGNGSDRIADIIAGVADKPCEQKPM